jgi:PAS domain-containing protein
MKKIPHSTTTLRQEAEQLLKTQRKAATPVASEDTIRLMHELQVHQIELELQNEELGKAYTEVAVLRDKYLDLYDFAPIGYFTVTPAGDITELNLSAATLLAEDRAALVGRRMRDFVLAESTAAFAEFLSTAGTATAEVSVTLTLRRGADEAIYVKAQGRRFESDITGGKEIRIVLMDLTALKSANEELLRSFEKFFKYWRP